jgi:hypothetical protein
MKFRRHLAVVLALTPLALFAGCSDDEDTDDEVELAEIADTWEASSFVYTSDSNPQQSVDLVDDFNATFTLQIDEDGDYQFVTNVPGENPDVETGDVEMVGDQRIQFDPSDSAPETADVTLSNDADRLTLFFEDAAFDFDEDGDEEEADLTVVLNRD